MGHKIDSLIANDICSEHDDKPTSRLFSYTLDHLEQYTVAKDAAMDTSTVANHRLYISFILLAYSVPYLVL